MYPCQVFSTTFIPDNHKRTFYEHLPNKGRTKSHKNGVKVLVSGSLILPINSFLLQGKSFYFAHFYEEVKQMCNHTQPGNKEVEVLKGKEEKKHTPDAPKKPARTKKQKPAKPMDFKEFEILAKEIVEANGESYYEWLHKQHQEIILNFNVHNRKQITEVAKQS